MVEDTRARITKDGIRIYEDADFAGMRQAGRVAAEMIFTDPFVARVPKHRWRTGNFDQSQALQHAMQLEYFPLTLLLDQGPRPPPAKHPLLD